MNQSLTVIVLSLWHTIQVLTIETIRKIIPETHWWRNESTTPNDYWDWHAGSETGKFATLEWFTPALNARLGVSTSADEYACKSQYMTYESHRAMIEAYSMNKYGDGNDQFASTGVVQWMLNSAWPSNIWHLYDYYGIGGGAFYGVKKATKFPLHLVFDYSSFGVKLIHSGYINYAGEFLKASASIFNSLDGKLLAKTSLILPPTIYPDSSTQLLEALPKKWFGLSNATLLLRLVLKNEDKKTLDIGTYTLASSGRSNDIVNFTSCNYFRCNLSSFANMRDLQGLPPANIDISWVISGSVLSINVGNPHDDRIAFFVNIPSITLSNNQIVESLVFTDNYFTLLPKEQRTISTTLAPSHFDVGTNTYAVKRVLVRVFNNCTRHKSTTRKQET